VRFTKTVGKEREVGKQISLGTLAVQSQIRPIKDATGPHVLGKMRPACTTELH